MDNIELQSGYYNPFNENVVDDDSWDDFVDGAKETAGNVISSISNTASNFFSWLREKTGMSNFFGTETSPVDSNSAKYTDGAHIAYDPNSVDSYVNAVNLENQWAREDMIRNEGYKREDSAYQRLFDDLRAAGVNPALLVSGASSTTGSANSASTASSRGSSTGESSRANAANSSRIFAAIIAALGLMISKGAI